MASLQESLEKFKKQQEKCQSTLSSIAAKAGSSKSTSSASPTPSTLTSSNAKSPAPPVKFSNDTERLQHINSIRKAPVGAQIKRVIQLLLEVNYFPLRYYLYSSIHSFVPIFLSFLCLSVLFITIWCKVQRHAANLRFLNVTSKFVMVAIIQILVDLASICSKI